MEQKHRSEFPENELWDLTALYQDQEDFLRAIEKAREDIQKFVRDYQGKLSTFEDFERAFAELERRRGCLGETRPRAPSDFSNPSG